MLIDEGASRGLEDAQGMSPLAHAREKDCITIIGMLEKADKRGRSSGNFYQFKLGFNNEFYTK